MLGRENRLRGKSILRLIIAAALLAVATILSPALHADSARIRHLWTVETGLFEPESVAIDEERGMIYVSNVVGYGKNGQGYLSRISMSGRVVDEKWIEGLDAPTGLAVHGDTLYFADYDQLRTVDLTTGELTASYPAPHEKPCLNDVAAADDGRIYVSASCIKTVYVLEGGSLRPLIEGRDALNFVNGIYVARDMILTGGWQIWIWDRESGEAMANGPVTRQADIHDIDGIAWDGEQFIFSMVNDARLWRLAASGEAAPISEEAYHAVDFQYDHVTGLLVMPRIGGEGEHKVSAYRLTFE